MTARTMQVPPEPTGLVSWCPRRLPSYGGGLEEGREFGSRTVQVLTTAGCISSRLHSKGGRSAEPETYKQSHRRTCPCRQHTS